MTQKDILKNMLDRVPEDYDKTEGGLFFDNLSPVSFEIENLLIVMKEMFDNTFGMTAKGKYLDLIVQEENLQRRMATKARGMVEFKGTQGTVIPKGFVVSSDSFNFKTLRECIVTNRGSIAVEIEAELQGSKSNLPVGAITKIPIALAGVNSVTNITETTDGFDVETDEELRERYLFKIRETITSGNIHHYKKWALEVDGVGAAKIFPLWAGNGTVKVVIIDNKKEIAQSELIQRVKAYIDSVRPVGATVTVASARPKLVNVNVNVEISKNTDQEEVKENIKKNLIKYFKQVAFADRYLSYAKVGSVVLQTEGVLDYQELKLNNDKRNVPIADEEIIQLGTCNIEVME